MTSSDCRILFSAIAVFVALGGIGVSIRGLLFDEPSFFSLWHCRCGRRRCVLRVATQFRTRRQLVIA
ncbi:DUF2964 domain-containing protein [Paraburkholderia sp. GV068]|nr:DUF2964 domain-containing protein [Paraburkholderia sp. GV068]